MDDKLNEMINEEEEYSNEEDILEEYEEENDEGLFFPDFRKFLK